MLYGNMMKRGKDDEKIMGPMFPRLHVNDTDKGGPRAPPRNKMALYEQLSIPSQRFNRHSLLPLNPNNTSSVVPRETSNRGSGMERSLHFQLRVPPSTSDHLAGKFHGQQPHGANVRTSLPWHDQKKRADGDDDVMVTAFVNSGMDQSHSRTNTCTDKEKLKPINPNGSGRLVKVQEVSCKDSKQNGSLSPYPGQEVRDRNEANQKASPLIMNQSASSAAREEMDGDKYASMCDRLNDPDVCLRQECRDGSDQGDDETGGKVESARDTDSRAEAQMGKGCQSRGDHSSPDEVDNDPEFCRSKTCISLPQKNGDASDGVSETSMVDSLSSLDISPDDVVGIIGQNHFWKARIAIANQQRVFAVQVFELHRLIKVQRLIAGSPNLLLEASAYLGKSSSKTSSTKKALPHEYVVKSLSHVTKRKHDSEMANHHELEFLAENTVGRTFVSLGKDNNQQSLNYKPFLGNPSPAPAASDAQMVGGNGGSWCFPSQPPPGNHQWLFPVMSPSEGLIYKPCHAPTGFMGPACGGYDGHFTPALMAGNFMGHTCSIPVPLYHQGLSVPPCGHSYFPPYGLLPMNPSFSGHPTEQKGQTNQFGHPSINLSGSTNIEQQSSCNFPNLNNGAVNVTQANKSQQCNKESSQLEENTVNSPGKKGTQRNVNIPQNVPPLLPTVQAENGGSRVGDVHPATRVIRVVPHKPSLATESAARIFQSIQAERKQNDLT